MAVSFYTPAADPAVPAGATVVTNDSELAAVVAARVVDGASEDVHLNGTFGPLFIDSYSCTDGGNGLRLYGNPTTRTSMAYGANTAGSCVLRMRFCDYVSVYNLDMDGNSTGTNGAIWGVGIGETYATDPNAGGCTHITIANCDVHDVRQETVMVSANGTSNVTVQDCNIYNSGRDTSKPELGELVYIGSGGHAVSVFDITIRGCEIYNNTPAGGEGIDVKARSGRVTIEDNYIHTVRTEYGGAITFWANNTQPGYNADGIIRRNRIYNVDKWSTGSADGISIGADCLVENNLIWDVDHILVRTVTTHAQTDKAVVVRHNTLDATGATAAIGVNTGNYGETGANNYCVMTTEANAYLGTELVVGTPNGSTHNNKLAVTSDFEGPITGTADAGDGNGSGFEPKSTGTLDDTGPTTVTTDDIQGFLRDLTPDWGAIELAATGTAFAITSPAQGDTGVTTPKTISGTAPDDGRNTKIRIRVYDETNSTTLEDWGDVSVTYTAGTETWATATTVTLPQAGETIRVDVDRWG